MKRNSKIVLILGCLLIAISFALLIYLQVQTKQAECKNAEIVQIIESIVSDHREGSIDQDREAKMPTLEVNGDDFVALLEFPSRGLTVPVRNTWDKQKVVFYPCRFSGSAYDGTLIIGGYDQAGQFDFFDRVQIGDTVIVTDMTGCVFSYEVSWVERSSSAQAEVLLDGAADLTLFVRDAQLLEYIILRCVVN